jgi:hypothetical protein
LQPDDDFTVIVPTEGRGKLFVPRKKKVDAYVDKILLNVTTSGYNSFYYRGPVGSGKVRKCIQLYIAYFPFFPLKFCLSFLLYFFIPNC